MSLPKYQPQYMPIDPCRDKNLNSLTKAYFKKLVSSAKRKKNLAIEREIDKRERQPTLDILGDVHEMMTLVVALISGTLVFLVLVSR